MVLYGEALDADCMRGAVNAIMDADMLIIGGTSLVVYPAAGFVNYFDRDKGKLVIINMSATSQDEWADMLYNRPIGEVLGEAVGV